jgi:hypothetical protein
VAQLIIRVNTLNKKRPIVDIIFRAGGLTSLADMRVRTKRPIQAKQQKTRER